MKGKQSAIRKIFLACIRVAGCMALAGILWTGLIEDHQVREGHLAPDVHAGRTYAKGIHGRDVYLTKSELDHGNHILYGSFALFGLTLLGIGIYRNIWYRDEEFGPATSGLGGRLK